MPRLRKRQSSPVRVVEEEEQQEEEEEQEEQQEEDEGQEGQDDVEVEGAPHVLRFNEDLKWRAGKPIAVSELLRRLRTLHEELSGMEQEDADRASLEPVAQDLAHRNLLEHRDRGVKAWTALCIVEMFKLLAPNAPFKGSQLKDIFSLIITSLLPALGNPTDPYNEQHLQVIRSLDEVKSIVLLTDISGAEALLYKLFTTAFDIFSGTTTNDSGEELSKNVEHHIASLLITVVDESPSLPNDVVDIILAQFLRVDPSTFPLHVKKMARQDQQQSGGGLFHMQQLPPAYNMAKNICNSCPDKMARMVSQYFNSILADADENGETSRTKKVGNKRRTKDDSDEDEDLAPSGPTEEQLESLNKTHRLLRELWRSAALVIQNIVPQLDTELNAENVQVRLLATETVGDLISGIGAAGLPPPVPMDPAAYPSQSSESAPSLAPPHDWMTTPAAPQAFSSTHPTAYQHFMGRRNDKSPLVRSKWVMAAGRIIATAAGGMGIDPEQEHNILKWTSDMLLDTDERVRLAAVQAVGRCDFDTIVQRIGSNGSVTYQGSILYNLAERIKDRKHSVRAEAMALLGRIWGVAAGAITEGDERVRLLLGAIPSKIFEAIYINDPEITALVQQVLTDSLLPLTFPPIKTKGQSGSNGNSQQRVKDSQTSEKPLNPDAIRAERILVLVRDLESRAKSVFFALQARQAKNAQYLEAYLKQCEAFNGGVNGKSGNETSEKLNRLIDVFASQRPDPITAADHLRRFAKKHDRRCYQLIRFAISPDSEYKKVVNAIKELTKRVEDGQGHSAATLATLLPIIHLASVLVYNKSHVPTIVELSRTEEKELGAAAHEVLKEISNHNPEVFKAHVRTLCATLEQEVPTPGSLSDSGVIETLKACAGFAQRYPFEIPHDREFLKSMVQFALHGSPPVAAKHAVSVIVAADEKKDMYVKEIATKCIEAFEYGSEGYLSRLAALSQLMLLAAADTEDEHDAILQIAIEQILMQVRTPSKGDEDPVWEPELDDECAAKIWALKILANRLRSYANSSSGAEMETTITEMARPVFKLLITAVTREGEISKKSETPRHHKAHLRLTAAILLLKLCGANKHLDALLSPADFDKLTIIAQDVLPEVRAGFINAIKKYLGQGRLPPRFYTLAFLFAYEPTVRIKDGTLTWLRGRAAHFSKTGDTVMEATFARFLSLLAHHPDFATDPDNPDPEILKDYVEYIMFYLKTVATQANIPTIYYIAQRCKSVADGVDPALYSENLYRLSDIAQAVIRRFQELHSWSLPVYSGGKLRLPRGLFAQLPNHVSAQAIADKQYAPEALLDQIDELVRISLKSKKRKAENGATAGNGTGAAQQTKKRVKTDKLARQAPTAVKKVKVVKTPKKKVRGDDAAPSSDVRRSTRRSNVKSYAESDEEGGAEGGMEVDNEDIDMDDDEDDDDEAQVEAQAEPEEPEVISSAEELSELEEVEEHVEEQEDDQEEPEGEGTPAAAEDEASDPQPEEAEEPDPEPEPTPEPAPKSRTRSKAQKATPKPTPKSTPKAKDTTNGNSRSKTLPSRSTRSSGVSAPAAAASPAPPPTRSRSQRQRTKA